MMACDLNRREAMAVAVGMLLPEVECARRQRAAEVDWSRGSILTPSLSWLGEVYSQMDSLVAPHRQALWMPSPVVRQHLLWEISYLAALGDPRDQSLYVTGAWYFDLQESVVTGGDWLESRAEVGRRIGQMLAGNFP